MIALQFLPAPVIYNTTETLARTTINAFKNVHWPGNGHVTDKAHGDNDPQVWQYALEDDLYANAVHNGALPSGMYTPAA